MQLPQNLAHIYFTYNELLTNGMNILAEISNFKKLHQSFFQFFSKVFRNSLLLHENIFTLRVDKTK